MTPDAKNVVLIGMMGSGKTTVGILLSQALQRSLVDTDQWIEQREQRKIPQIFQESGELCFRTLELEACRELSQRDNLIIACGGGLPLTAGCMEELKKNGRIFWLDRDPGESYDGMEKSDRPLAQQGRENFLSLFASRKPVYRKWSDVIITDFSSPEETAKRILEELP